MSKRQTANSTLCIPGLDMANLQAYLATAGISLVQGVSPKKFTAGLGNLNFLLETEDGPLVLRRPPLGSVPPGANDMAREHRILSHLHPALPLVPEARLFCENPTVIGAPFLLMEYRPGLVIGSELTSDTIDSWQGDCPIGAALGYSIIDVLTRLHSIDFEACGLGTLGRPEGFAVRTEGGWCRRARLAWGNAPSEDLAALLGWLGEHHPETSRTPSLIHNDFKLDNIILNPDTLEPRTLIDWDMGTLGDPLYDLAVLLSYWTEADDPEPMHMLRQMPTAHHGFPTREEAAALYAKASGRTLQEFTFFRVLATLRIAVVFQQLYRRYESGATDDPKFARFDDLARGLLHFGMQVARGQHF